MVGEALDGWLVSYAHLLKTTVGDIAAQARLPEGSLSTNGRKLALGESLPDLSSLEETVGLANSSLWNLTSPLTRYDDAFKSVASPQFGNFMKVSPWSRYCPECLDQDGGRWQSSWRLGWKIACPLHHVLLVDKCLTCGARQRQRRIHPYSVPLDPAVCQEPERGSKGRIPHSCQGELAAAPRVMASAPIVELTSRLTSLFLNFGEHPQGELPTLLTDWVVLARTELRRHPPRKPIRIWTDVGSLAPAFEVAAEAMLDLSGPTFDALARPDLTITRPRLLSAGWARASARLTVPAIQSRSETLRPADRLRWRIDVGTTPPSRDLAYALSIRKRIPAALWPEWSLRLLPLNLQSTHGLLPAVAAVALMLPGSSLATTQLCELLPEAQVDAASVNRCLKQLTNRTDLTPVLAVIAELAEWISTRPVPIDYERRRQLPVDDRLLSQRRWRELCGRTRTQAGESLRFVFARIWLWEMLTGGSFEQVPHELLARSSAHGTGYVGFTRRMTPALTAELTRHAAAVLGENGINDEPLVWAPPVEAISRIGWPGLETQSIDQASLARLVHSDLPLGAIANELGISVDHVRLVLRNGGFGQERTLSAHARKYISEVDLRRAMVEEGLTTRAAARTLGIARGTLRNRCREYQVPVKSPGASRRWRIDREWLSTQYLEYRRTLPDLALEIGCSPANLARAANELGVPLRQRGGASHDSALRPRKGFPPLLARATRGQSGIQRVQRFAVMARSASLNRAAIEMKVYPSVLCSQLAKLEHDVGGALLRRTTPTGSLNTLTPLGERLRRQISEFIDGDEEETVALEARWSA